MTDGRPWIDRRRSSPPSMRGLAGGVWPYGGSALCLRYVLLLFARERSSFLLSLTIEWRLVIACACRAFIKWLTLNLSVASESLNSKRLS